MEDVVARFGKGLSLEVDVDRLINYKTLNSDLNNVKRQKL